MTYFNHYKWEKVGLIYKPNNTIPWSVTHAQAPVADYIEDKNIIRVYFSTRNIDGLSLPTFVDLNADNPLEIIHINESPLLDLGSLGTFDDRGVMPSWVVNRGDERWLYYIGWNVRDNISYHNSVGLAIASSSDDKFVRFSEGPLWDRDWKEPYFSASTCVLFDDGVWKNWYLSCTGWKVVNGKSEPRYHIKYAESEDGINWVREGKVAIDYKNEEEAGIVKASVVKENGRYRMWFSYRNFTNYRTDPKASYRIGYAESKDGIVWNRNDDLAGIDISASGWDSEMIAYPHVIKVKESYLMFYNGNGFGRSGFGYARLLK